MERRLPRRLRHVRRVDRLQIVIEQQLRPYVEDTVRSEIPKRKLDEAYEEKEAVAIAVKQTLEVRRCTLPRSALRSDR